MLNDILVRLVQAPAHLPGQRVPYLAQLAHVGVLDAAQRVGGLLDAVRKTAQSLAAALSNAVDCANHAGKILPCFGQVGKVANLGKRTKPAGKPRELLSGVRIHFLRRVCNGAN